MRPHGRANVDGGNPRAWGICDRCGFLYNHNVLSWQFEWFGPRVQNKRLLVCPDCMDNLQEQLRTIVLPTDPEPIMSPRPDDFLGANDGGVGIAGPGFDPSNLVSVLPHSGANIGSMSNLDAAFDGSANKLYMLSTRADQSTFGYNNWVGKNWNMGPAGLNLLSSAPLQTHTVAAFTLIPPNDKPFFGPSATLYQFQGSANAITWTTLASGTTTGASITASGVLGNPYQYHRVVFNGDGVSPIGIAQLQISIYDWPSPEV